MAPVLISKRLIMRFADGQHTFSAFNPDISNADVFETAEIINSFQEAVPTDVLVQRIFAFM